MVFCFERREAYEGLVRVSPYTGEYGESDFDLELEDLSLHYTSPDITKEGKYYKIKLKDGQELLPVEWIASLSEIDRPGGDAAFSENNIYEMPAGGLSGTFVFHGKYTGDGNLGEILKLRDLFDSQDFMIPADREGIYIIRIYNGLLWSVSEEEKRLIEEIPEGSEISRQACINNIVRIVFYILDTVIDYDLIKELFGEDLEDFRVLILDVLGDVFKLIKNEDIKNEDIFKNIIKKVTEFLVEKIKEKLYGFIIQSGQDDYKENLFKKITDYLWDKKEEIFKAITGGFKDFLLILKIPKFIGLVKEAQPFYSVPKSLETAVVKVYRSEERRVGKECRSRWSPYH